MYIQFLFGFGSNPYISTTIENTWKMFCKYCVRQIGENTFIVDELREWNGKRTYKGYQELLQALAIDWQYNFNKYNYSYSQVSDWEYFFETYGKKYGLLKEFKENAIC